MPPIVAVDLFCGAGGLTHGLLKEGIMVKAGVDVDPACEYPFARNNQGARFILKSVSELEPSDILEHYPAGAMTVLAGCAPCQPFSTYSRGRAQDNKDKWGLLYEFLRLVRGSSPDVVTMENVVQVKNHAVFNEFVHGLEDMGYTVTTYEVFGPDYGIPQTRRRLVLFGSKYGEIRLPIARASYRKQATVRRAIGNLEPISAGERSKRDRMHVAPSLSPINLERIRASTPGGSWQDWSEELVSPCHQAMKRPSYVSVYGRMEWDEPSPTITTQCYKFGCGRFGHPDQDRAISLREAAILQTFPRSYRFVPPNEPVYFARVGALIGNAVPVRLGRVVGSSIVRHLAGLDRTLGPG